MQKRMKENQEGTMETTGGHTVQWLYSEKVDQQVAPPAYSLFGAKSNN